MTNPGYSKVKRCIEKRREAVRKIKESSPCTDCNKFYPYYVMDFDHREDEKKEFNISKLSRIRLERVLKEIEKCDLVCSNCHRIRTHKRKELRNQ